MIIPDGLLNTVAFVCYRDKQHNIRFAGTVFFIREVDEKTNLTFPFTITALHVINKIEESSSDGVALLRLNKRLGGFEYVPTQVSDWKGARQDEEAIDVAVLEFGADSSIYDVLYIDVSTHATNDMVANNLVGIGNEIIIVGLFVNHEGRNRNVPIIRYGNIAMMPEDKVKTNIGEMRGFLIESRSTGGLSGSPVFVWTDRHIERKTPTGSISSQMILWLGLIHGHYNLPAPIPDAIVEDFVEREVVNMGIAIVVPATKILEVIHDIEDLQKSRKRQIDEVSRYSSASQDDNEMN